MKKVLEILTDELKDAFYGTEREIVLPEGITTIANGVFKNTGIRSIKLPSTLKSIGVAFAFSDMLEEIIIPEGIPGDEELVVKVLDSIK